MATPQQPLDLQAIVNNCLHNFNGISHNDIIQLLRTYHDYLKQHMQNVIHLPAPMVIVGNLRGQWEALEEIWHLVGTPPNINFLFLGGILNGEQSLRMWCLLLCWQLMYKKQVHILRGKQEHSMTVRHNRTFAELVQRFGTDAAELIMVELKLVFDYMPLVAIVGEQLFCVHSGLDPGLLTVDKYKEQPRPSENSDFVDSITYSKPQEIKGWQLEPEGTSFYWGQDVSEAFLQANNLSMIISSALVASEGFHWAHEGAVLLTFSCSLSTFKNACSIVHVDEAISCEVCVFVDTYLYL